MRQRMAFPPTALTLALSRRERGHIAASWPRWERRPGAVFLARLLKWPEKAEGEEDKDEKDEEEAPLESDRPDFTECTTTVGQGRFQVESGYTHPQHNGRRRCRRA